MGAAGVGLSMLIDSPIVVPFSILTAALVAVAYGVFLDGRVRMHETIGRSTIVLVAIVGGAVGFLVAHGIESLIPDRTEDFLTGPIEEPAKLIVPLLLFWLGGERFRDPRAGLAIVLASAAGVGVIEDGEYVLTAFNEVPAAFGHGMDTLDEISASVSLERPLMDAFVHMSLTGMIGAVAWRTWWLRGGFRITWGIAGAFALACVLHSAFDTVSAGNVVLYVFLTMYLGLKLTGREDVPPNAIAEVPPGWRPGHMPERLLRHLPGRGAPKYEHPAGWAAAGRVPGGAAGAEVLR